MASTNIKSVSNGVVWTQTGNGVPDHIAIKGTSYIDLDTVTEYLNKNGLSLWEPNSGGVPSTDIYISGMTFDPNDYDLILNRNDGVTFTQNLGILASDITVTGGTYSDGTTTFRNNTGGTFNVSGFFTGTTNTITGTGVSNRVAFWNGVNSQTSDAGFIWDNTNKRLGVNNPSPLYAVDAFGTITGAVLDNVMRASSNANYVGITVNATKPDGTGQTNFLMQKNGSATFQFGCDYGATGMKDFFVYDASNFNTPFYITNNGDLRLGSQGTATSGGYFNTQRMTVKTNGSVLINTTTDNGVDILQANGSILGSGFKIPSGTATQFLKANGTIDSNTYLLAADIAGKENKSEKGQPDGYAPLDSNTKVPLSYINDALLGNVKYQGLWEQTSNTPDLTVVQNKGYYYICNGLTQATVFGIVFNLGDWIISDGVSWSKVDNTDAVSTVYGRTGNIIAVSGDYNTNLVTETTNKRYQTDNQRTFNDATSSIQTQLNGKQATLTNPITGTGTANYLAKFNGTTLLGNSSIFDNGNVGIGTVNPTSKLHVNGDVASESIDGRITLSTEPTQTNIFSSTSGFTAYKKMRVISDGFVLRNGLNSSDELTLLSNGNIGIGTSIPVGKLQIKVGADQNLTMLSDGVIPIIASVNDISNTYVGMGLDGDSLNFKIRNISKAFINSDGNFGIGTVIPMAKLDVESGQQQDSASTSSAGAYLKGVDVGVAFGQFSEGGGYGSWMQSIRRSDQASFRLSINPNGGNVVIGSISDDGSRLQVGGAMRSRNNVGGYVEITTNSTSDGSINFTNTLTIAGGPVTVNGPLKAYTIEANQSKDIGGTNLNDLLVTGFFVGASMVNAPNGEWWYITSEVFSIGGYRKQTATSFGGGANSVIGGTTYIRAYVNDTTWESWRQLVFV